MDLTKIPLFQLITKRMAWLGDRQKVLSENLANTDTPDYKARDMKAFDFRSFMKDTSTVKIEKTNDKHLGPASGEQRFKVDLDRKPFENTPSQNKVVLEEQLMKMAETQADYQMTTNLYSKHVAMIKAALGRGA